MYNAKRLITPFLKNTLIHHMDPRTKIVVLIALSMIVISVDEPKTLMILCLFSLVGYPMARVPFSNIKMLFIMLLLLVWGSIYSQALFYQQFPRTAVFTILPENSLGFEWDGLHVFREGIEYGAIQSMRLASTTALALLFYWTTEPNAMLMGLIKLKVPYGLAFMVITSLRFIPLLISEAITVFRAQKLKAYSPFRPTNWPRTIFMTLVPILANCIRRSSKLAISVEARTFKPDASRTFLKADKITLSFIDRVFMVLSLTAIPIMASKVLFWLYENDIVYFSELRWLYEITGKYI